VNHLTSYSDHYFIYHSLDTHGKVKYYLDKIKNNNALDYYEKLELSIDYTIALFEIGKYEKYLYIVDEVIEKVIEENIWEVQGVDAFEALLFRKAASHYNLAEYDAAIIILRQLVKINEHENLYKNLLSKAVRRDRHKNNNGLLRPITVLCFLTAVALKLLDIFVIDSFYNQYHMIVSMVTYAIFLLGTSIMAIDYARYLIARYR
jgi:tetratricopeptide (TPR) repeat protein